MRLPAVVTSARRLKGIPGTGLEAVQSCIGTRRFRRTWHDGAPGPARA